ncbi:MAG: hypothetical protein EA383_00355 [Spirochaetaceae bacterium]|nr:MAG: hypothetical protein EA383_00355 [Spirochaetaceae bacterium]
MKQIKTLSIIALLGLAALLAGCGNEAGPNLGDLTDDSPEAGGGGTSGEQVTITFVLDMDAGDGLTLTTSATAPAPITVNIGDPVRLNQGIGFTATGPGPGGPESTIFHASGWSTETYEEQFEKIINPSGPAPTGSGYYLPGFEAIFSEDTTVYVRWLPEFDHVTARITYQQPGGGTNAATTAVLHLRDEIPFESMSNFNARIAPPWTVSQNERVFTWSAVDGTVIFSRSATDGKPAVWQFAEANPGFLEVTGTTGLREITMTYTPKQVHTVTFDFNGAPGGSGSVTREAYDGVVLSNNPDWNITPAWNSLTFAGWFTDPGFTTSWTTATATAPVTLYARWQADVTFNPGGGNGGIVIQTLDVDTEGTVAVPTVTTPHDTWDVFAGWFADSAYTQPITLTGGRLPVTGNRTVYAGWGPKYNVGDVGPGGGRIFHIHGGTDPRTTVGNPQGSGPGMQWRYLEVAPTDAAGVGSWATPNMLSTFFTQSNHDTLGGGISATDQIIGANSGSSLTDYAAYYVKNTYTSPSEFDDWYLPSVVELKEIADSGVWQHPEILMGTLQYWSSSSYVNTSYSSEDMGTRVFTVSLTSGNPVVGTTLRGTGGGSLRARPIRRF